MTEHALIPLIVSGVAAAYLILASARSRKSLRLQQEAAERQKKLIETASETPEEREEYMRLSREQVQLTRDLIAEIRLSATILIPTLPTRVRPPAPRPAMSALMTMCPPTR